MNNIEKLYDVITSYVKMATEGCCTVDEAVSKIILNIALDEAEKEEQTV